MGLPRVAAETSARPGPVTGISGFAALSEGKCPIAGFDQITRDVSDGSRNTSVDRLQLDMRVPGRDQAARQGGRTTQSGNVRKFDPSCLMRRRPPRPGCCNQKQCRSIPGSNHRIGGETGCVGGSVILMFRDVGQGKERVDWDPSVGVAVPFWGSPSFVVSHKPFP